MSGFERALGALSAREMRECARGLLRVLAGDAGGSSTLAASGGGGRVGARGASAGAEAGASGGGGEVSPVAAAGRAGREVRGLRGVGGRQRRGGSFEGSGGAESVTERGEGPGGLERRGGSEALDGVERRGRGVSPGARERESAERGEVSCGAGAAFAGPERRYENAVGARGMEMGRVSDYFRRDSRRYDGGYTRF